MSSRSILLIEVLDTPGADAADAPLRVQALRAAGWSARALTLGPQRSDADLEAWAGLARRVSDEPARELWVAGSRAGFDAVSRVVRDARPLRWWPTSAPAERASGSAPALVTSAPRADESAALELAVVRPFRPRERSALWDGAFALVPAPLAGEAGKQLLAAFADVARERPELDLVVLADPQPARLREARELGVYHRVHFAGEAPRNAEHVWLATAAAVLLPFVRPVAAGLLVRVLAAGTPLVAFGEPPLTRWLSAWLAARIGLEAQPSRQALESALERPATLRRALDRGRELATAHEPDALGRRLLGPGDAERERTRVA
jgi:hypothetical protein